MDGTAGNPRVIELPEAAQLLGLSEQGVSALAEAGWHILLEKPMAPTEQECRDIHAAVVRAGVMFAVAHVLRYAAYTGLAMLAATLVAEQAAVTALVLPLLSFGFLHSGTPRERFGVRRREPLRHRFGERLSRQPGTLKRLDIDRCVTG